MDDKSKVTLPSLKKLLVFTRIYWKWLCIYCVSTIIGATVSILIAHPMRILVDKLLVGSFSGLKSAIIYLLILMPIGTVFAYLGKYSADRFSILSTERIKVIIAEHYLKVPVSELEKTPVSEMVSRLTNDVLALRNFLSSSFGMLLYQPLLFLGTFLYLLFINWKLLLFSIILIPVIISLNIFLGKSLANRTRKLYEDFGKVNEIVTDTIDGVPIIKSYNLYEVFSEKYNNKVKDILNKTLGIELLNSWLTPLSYVIKIVPSIMCIIFGAYLTINQQMTSGDLMAFVYLFNFLSNPAMQMPKLVNDFRVAMVLVNRIFEILDVPEEDTSKEDFIPSLSSDAIDIKSVTFYYNEGKKILDNLTFTIPSGKVTAIVGDSGCGKSTIIKLLSGFYSPQEGNILIMGNNMSNVKSNQVRKMFAVVSQDTFLFPLSILENIGFGKWGATKQEIIAAAVAANAHDFIMELPMGYETVLGERGCRLSGGQRQRLSIARAILKDAPMLFLDEPTASLDVESEMLVDEALRRIIKNKTVIVISHRASTIVNSDKIVLLDSGEIVDEGTYEELMERSQQFKQLYAT